MYEILEKYLNRLIDESTVEQPIWNMEKIRMGKPITWNYIDGCMMNSFMEMYKITNNQKYLTFVDEYISYFINEDGSIRTYKKEEYILDDICECKVLFDLYKFTKREKYLKAIEWTYEHLENQPRTKEGNFWHKKIYPYQVWLDGLYMAMPFYVNYLNLKE